MSLSINRTCLTDVIWGVVLAALICRHFLSLDAGHFFDNHDDDGYALRLIEFRGCLAEGYLFPQWCTHFRSGLGSPFFNYYQPGFFYLASLAPASLPAVHQVGLAVFVLCLTGFLGMYTFTRRYFGPLAGTLAGTCLLTSPYVYTNLYIRGDYSEFGAMMLVPGFWGATLRFAETPSRWFGCLGAVFGAAIVATHPAIALTTYGLTTCLFGTAALVTRNWTFAVRTFTVLSFGVGLSAFYWYPLFAEMSYVSASKAWTGAVYESYYHFSKHFIALPKFFSFAPTETVIPVKLGILHLFAGLAGLLAAVFNWRKWDTFQQRYIVLCVLLFGISLFLITPQSVLAWEYLPLLNRIQFPWRLLSLVSIGLAALAGVSTQLYLKAYWRGFVSVTLLLGVTYIGVVRVPKIEAVVPARTPGDIADRFFAPDLAGEWLPVGSVPIQLKPDERIPLSNTPVTIESYQLGCGWIRCRMATTRETRLVLPHYHFPVGFFATLNGIPWELGRNKSGLMTLDVPQDFSGELLLRWRTTRAKWLGVELSLLSILIGTGFLWRPTTRPT